MNTILILTYEIFLLLFMFRMQSQLHHSFFLWTVYATAHIKKKEDKQTLLFILLQINIRPFFSYVCIHHIIYIYYINLLIYDTYTYTNYYIYWFHVMLRIHFRENSLLCPSSSSSSYIRYINTQIIYIQYTEWIYHAYICEFIYLCCVCVCVDDGFL